MGVSGASGTAERIRTFRIRAGLSKDEVAQSLGLNGAWYEDLERDDDEPASTLTLFQALDLAALLGVRLDEIFAEHGTRATPVELVELPQSIERYAAAEGISIAQLEAQLDWPLEAFMTAPVQTAAELPIAFFQSLASTLGFDWLSLVPGAEL